MQRCAADLGLADKTVAIEHLAMRVFELRAIEAAVPPGKQVHAILDNYAAHKHPKSARGSTAIRAGPSTSCRHPAPWLNAVEGFFAKLAKRQLKRGVFPSVVALHEAINLFLATHNRHPKPFVWQADPKAIIGAAKRGYQALDSIH